MARQITLQDHYTQLGITDDKLDIPNLSTAGTVGLLISIFSFIFGLLEGWANTVNESSGGIGIHQPALIVLFSVVFVSVIHSVLSVLDMIRDRQGPVRTILRMPSDNREN